MMRINKKIAAALFLFPYLLSACATAATSTPLPGLEATLVIRTMAAIQGVSSFAYATPSPVWNPAIPNEPLADVLSYNAPANATPVPSLTPISANNSNFSNPGQCLNRAQFVQDITIADYTEVKPGQKFIKTWELRNVGDCTWSPDYSLVFKFGDKMDGLTPKPLGVAVGPGETVNVSVELVAPKDASLYQGNWSLQDNYGREFSCGSGSRDYFWVSIMVGDKKLKVFGGGCGGGG
jgi:hypothetical protein